MTKPRRKPRYCRLCGKPLRTAKTGRWFFCEPPPEVHGVRFKSCQELYLDEHEPDADPGHLLEMLPTDEDDDGVITPPVFCPEE